MNYLEGQALSSLIDKYLESRGYIVKCFRHLEYSYDIMIIDPETD